MTLGLPDSTHNVESHTKEKTVRCLTQRPLLCSLPPPLPIPLHRASVGASVGLQTSRGMCGPGFLLKQPLSLGAPAGINLAEMGVNQLEEPGSQCGLSAGKPAMAAMMAKAGPQDGNECTRWSLWRGPLGSVGGALGA